MSYYTVVPRVMAGGVWLDNFCSGNWQVLNNGQWLQLTPSNTRVRDKNNLSWIEVCEGQLAESDSGTDCSCYSQTFNVQQAQQLHRFAVEKNVAETVDFILYGQLIGVADFTPFVYIPYYIQIGDIWQIRMYCINKIDGQIDNITVDSVSEPVPANVYVDQSSVVIKTPAITYKVGYNYIINSNTVASTLVNYVTNIDGIVTINDGQISYNGQIYSIVKGAQYSNLIYEDQLCFSAYADKQLSIYNLGGELLGTSVSDAKSVFFFDRNSNLTSVEGHNNLIQIKGVTL